jgi:3-hydroxyisobutyrate dehydrogenase-like beta-hydroxyacid dehydrogenase
MAQSNINKKNVGVIGLGIIGTRVAAGLRHAGFNVYVWNRTPKPAPNFLGSPAEVAEQCEVIQLFVADAKAVMETIDAISETLTPDHVIVCNATIGLEGTLEAARRVRQLGARFLDAPFTGSKGAAEKRQLVYYIGGEEQDFLRVQPVLEATSKAIVHIGEVGQAAVVKVVTNLISAVTTQTLAEGLAIVRRAGIRPEKLADAIEQNAMRSGVTDLKLPAMVSGDYTPHFAMKHMFKDVQLGIRLANQFEIEVPATSTVGAVMYGALAKGWGDLDYAALSKAYENGVHAPKPPTVAPSDAE